MEMQVAVDLLADAYMSVRRFDKAITLYQTIADELKGSKIGELRAVVKEMETKVGQVREKRELALMRDEDASMRKYLEYEQQPMLSVVSHCQRHALP